VDCGKVHLLGSRVRHREIGRVQKEKAAALRGDEDRRGEEQKDVK
jgi:hypothetical protein